MKAQALPISVIVTGVLVLIVVGVVMLAFGGGFSGVMSRLNIFAAAQTGEDTDLMATKCRQACASLKNSAKNSFDILNSEFCILRWNTEESGGINGDTCVDDTGDDVVKVSCNDLSVCDSGCAGCGGRDSNCNFCMCSELTAPACSGTPSGKCTDSNGKCVKQ